MMADRLLVADRLKENFVETLLCCVVCSGNVSRNRVNICYNSQNEDPSAYYTN